MTGCSDENTPVQYRYSATGILQRSFNAGGSWSDCAEYDTRNYSVQFPPVAGEDNAEKRCVASVGAVALIKEQVGDNLTDGMTRASLENLIRTWVTTFIQTSNPFSALVTVMTNLIFGLVITTLRAALTTETYTALECAIYCNVGDDLTVTQAQHEQMRSDILANISGIAGLFFEHLIYLLGVRGVENLLRSGGATSGDCSGCTDCAETGVFFTNNGLGCEQIFPDGEGVYTVSCTDNTSGGYYGNVSFYNTSGAPNYDACGTINILTLSSGAVSVKLDCGTGASNPLSSCYALVQIYSAYAWTMTFTIGGCT